MWKVHTSVGGYLGHYPTKAEAQAVAKEYNRKGNRPGRASIQAAPQNNPSGARQMYNRRRHNPSHKKPAAGGVLIDQVGRILVREVANKWGGTVWSLPKGQVDPGESGSKAARREVQEETGWEGTIIATIPGSYEGFGTITTYYLMKPVRYVGGWQFMDTIKEETWSIAWVPYDACATLFDLGDKGSADRDKEVVFQAFKLWRGTPAGLKWMQKRGL